MTSTSSSQSPGSVAPFDGPAAVTEPPVALARRIAASVPAYDDFLRWHGVDPASIVEAADFRRLPPTDRRGYLAPYPLPQRCRNGRLDGCDTVAVSSGSSGHPTVWPRSVADELAASRRFEQVFRDAFGAAQRSTLAVVCFPMGTWVGGLFTTACMRHLAAAGLPVTVVAPGNDLGEILRVVPELAPHVDQVVLLGYPPFVKNVVDAGIAVEIDWSAYDLKLVLAGEAFSEEWRDLVAQRAGIADPARHIAALYGTADAGVLANETPLSVAVRRFLVGRPDLARALFGASRLPALFQFDPTHRYVEQRDGALLLTADGGAPLVRYAIGDQGGVLAYEDVLTFCAQHGFDPVAASVAAVRTAPFVYVFGRALSTVSFFGANVYPENIAPALERAAIAAAVTGRFVLETREDGDRELHLAVELTPGGSVDADALAAAVRAELLRTNSEFAHYVPAERQLPEVTLRPAGDPEYFPLGVKHRYVRRESSGSGAPTS